MTLLSRRRRGHQHAAPRAAQATPMPITGELPTGHLRLMCGLTGVQVEQLPLTGVPCFLGVRQAPEWDGDRPGAWIAISTTPGAEPEIVLEFRSALAIDDLITELMTAREELVYGRVRLAGGAR